MTRLPRLFLPIVIIVACVLTVACLTGSNRAFAKTTSESGSVKSLCVEQAASGKTIVLRGRDARQQLCVTGIPKGGTARDLTRSVRYDAEPAGIVTIDPSGLVTPLTDGTAKLRVTGTGGLSSRGCDSRRRLLAADSDQLQESDRADLHEARLQQRRLPRQGERSKRLQAVAVGLRSRGRLRVPGERRTRPTAVSLVARAKACCCSSRPAARRTAAASGWTSAATNTACSIAGSSRACPTAATRDPTVVAIECVPAGRVMERQSQQQITVMARYSDGATEDVTRMSLFEANDTEMAEAGNTGLVKTLDLAGRGGDDGPLSGAGRHVPGHGAARCQRRQAAGGKELRRPRGLRQAQGAGHSAVAACRRRDLSASRFDRHHRDHADRREVTRIFGRQGSGQTRQAGRPLLASTAYADYFANKWNMVLRNKKRNPDDTEGTYEFYQWIWNSLYENKPFDRFVREILTASGDPRISPPVIWYREVDEVNEQVEDTAQLFLGLRIQCARCHHHPFEKWSQDDYYGFSAFFSRLGTQAAGRSAAQQAA